MSENLTTVETSELTSIPVATLRWYRHAGIGPVSFKLGGHVRYRREALDRWMTDQYEASATQKVS